MQDEHERRESGQTDMWVKSPACLSESANSQSTHRQTRYLQDSMVDPVFSFTELATF